MSKNLGVKANAISQSEAYKAAYINARDNGMTSREAKRYARSRYLGKVDFSPLEQKIMEENPQLQGKVSDFQQEVEAYTGFRIQDGLGEMLTQWKKTYEPLVF